MSHKFDKDRSVTREYCKIPLYYTDIVHPQNKDKVLVLMDRIGDNYTACWRNIALCKTGIEFLVKATDKGFIFKGKEINTLKRVL